MKKNKISFTTLLKNTLYVFGIVLTIIVGIVVINNEIESKVQIITSSDSFINTLIARIHPYVIFDENGSILYDMGGMSYLDTIIVEKSNLDRKPSVFFPSKMTIRPKNVLQTSPLLECIDSEYTYSITVERGPFYDWIYTFQLVEYNIPKKINLFRLDILW